VTHPKLSVPSSGLGGRGYRQIFDDGTPVPSVTTALGALEKPGIVNWHVEQTAAFAVANIDNLLQRDEEQGMRFLQFYSRRLKPDKVDDIDVYNYSMGVLDDLADVGNFIHDYIEADLNDWIPPEPDREDKAEMVDAYHEWRDQHDVEALTTEATVFGDGYAGTLDAILKVDGELMLIDVKSSRRVYDSHVAQLAALGAAHSMAVEVEEGTEGSVYSKIVPSVAKHHGGQVDSWWLEEPLPPFTSYGVLQVRPSDYDNDGEYVAPFCKLHTIPHSLVEASFGLFQAGLMARKAKREYDKVVKEFF